MFHLVDNLQDKSGNALAGYYVKLKVPGGAYATLYADTSRTPILSVSGVANTAVTDANGRYDLYVDDGTYDLEFFDKNDINQRILTVSAVPLLATTFVQSGTGAVSRTVQDKARETVSAFDFLSPAERTDVSSYTGALDVTAALQAALNAAWDSKRDLFIPAGLYKVTGIVIPGTAAGRTRAFRVYGQGGGELFARGESGGTIIKQSGTTGSLVSNVQDLANAGNGNIEVAYIRFEGNSASPVIDFQTLYAQSEFHHCGVFQSGAGDGIRIRHANTIDIHHNYVLNSHWGTTSGVTRTGIGIHVTLTNDNGLLTLRKNTSRGFETGYKFGATGSGGYFYNMRMDACEASVTTNGVWLTDRVRSSLVKACYIEGGDGGFGVKDEGEYNTLSDNHFFAGYTTVIDSSSSNIGSTYTGNTIALGAVANAVGMKLSGGETATGNVIVRTAGTAGQKGIQLSGSVSRINYGGNHFSPSSAWDGAGTEKIDNTVTGGGGIGFGTAYAGAEEWPHMARGSASYMAQTLTNANLSGSTLVLPEWGSHFYVNMTPVAINAFDGGGEDGREITIIDLNSNLDFNPTAQIKLNGDAAFTAKGAITFVLQRIASTTYAYEKSRTTWA